MKKCDNCPIIDGECNQAMCDQTQANYKRMSETAARKIADDVLIYFNNPSYPSWLSKQWVK